MERIYAVGDIHGRYDKLVELLGRIDVDFSSDRLVFLGDYVDRGEQSYEVIEHLVALKKHHPYPQTVFLKGNHEDMMEKYLADQRRPTDLGELHAAPPEFGRALDSRKPPAVL